MAEGSAEVEYFVDNPYPGSSVIHGISERLTATGWLETNEPLAGPAANRATRTWSHYLQRSDEGDFLTYFLTYRRRVGARAVRVRVEATRMMAATVAQIRKMCEQYRCEEP